MKEGRENPNIFTLIYAILPLIGVIVGVYLTYYLGISTTTLNSFKKDHKAHITGLELGLETPFNFTEIQKHLKILGFHF